MEQVCRNYLVRKEWMTINDGLYGTDMSWLFVHREWMTMKDGLYYAGMLHVKTHQIFLFPTPKPYTN